MPPAAALALALALASVPDAGRAPGAGVEEPAPGPDPQAAATLAGAVRDTIEEVVVVGTRSPRRAASLPTTVTVVTRDALDRSAAPTLDGALRSVPSLGVFRRSTSLAADPSSQGLSLRGVAPSAVARALLLEDGVPVDDPFFGFVPWRSLPRLGLARVEVAPGGASALYGSAALGGVVALVPRPVSGTGLEAETFAGSFGTYGVAARIEGRRGPSSGALEAEHSGTDGHAVVAPWMRGPIDGRAGARHATVTARAATAPRAGLTLRLGAGFFDEAQDGGTLHTNATARSFTARAGVEATGPAGRVSLLAYGGARRFGQERTRPAQDRTAETLAAVQDVPSTDLGASLVAAPARTGDHALSAGADLRRVAGESDEDLFPSALTTTAAVARSARGAQWTGGAFVQDAWTPVRALEVGIALRADAWRQEGADVSRTLGGGAIESRSFPARTRGLLSPRVAARWTLAPPLTVRASAYRSFRAPTLNELYRPFQVGTLLTAANPDLRPEVLAGAEGGAELAPASGVRLRVTGFWSALDAAIAVVALPVPLDDGATRRRENLGRVVIRGVEAEAVAVTAPGLEAAASYTLADARVTSAPGRPELVGKRLAHDPAHRLTAALGFRRPRLLAARLEVRWLSRAFEDDQNTLPLPAFAVVDASASVPLGRTVELFAAADNLLDRRYLVGRAGVDTIGAPRLVRAGVRVRADAAAR